MKIRVYRVTHEADVEVPDGVEIPIALRDAVARVESGAIVMHEVPQRLVAVRADTLTHVDPRQVLQKLLRADPAKKLRATQSVGLVIKSDPSDYTQWVAEVVRAAIAQGKLGELLHALA